jgi:hypothetical protein
MVDKKIRLRCGTAFPGETQVRDAIDEARACTAEKNGVPVGGASRSFEKIAVSYFPSFCVAVFFD